MWLHIVIFAFLLVLFAAVSCGWFSMEQYGTKKGRQLFWILALAGNGFGLILTCTTGGGEVYPNGYEMKKKEVSYEEKFMVSVEGEAENCVYIQIPEKEVEEEDSEQQENVSEEKKLEQELLEYVETYNNENGNEEVYCLPEDWNGKKIQWRKPEDHTGTLFAALMLAGACSMLVLSVREEQKQRVKRYDELMRDYPGLIMKFTLLVQAGMTVRNAFRKIAVDYKRKKEKRAAYEEIVTICYEMESGVSEAEAYRRFGERCGHVKYKTFAALLIQNLQKGSRQMGEMLEKESMEAWDDRKRKAKVLGEAAATKLLVPMILMLLVVMAIIMLPACLSFYG